MTGSSQNCFAMINQKRPELSNLCREWCCHVPDQHINEVSV